MKHILLSLTFLLALALQANAFQPLAVVGGAPAAAGGAEIAHDSESTHFGTIDGPTYAHTLVAATGNNRKCIVTVTEEHGITGGEDGRATAVTFDGAAMTERYTALHTENDTDAPLGVQLFTIDDADLPATGGAYNVVLTFPAQQDRHGVGVLCVTDAAQGAPEATAGGEITENGTTISYNITTLTDGAWIISTVGTRNNPTAWYTAGVGQTSFHDQINTSHGSQGTYETKAAAGLDAQSHAWTNATNHAIAGGIAVAPAS